MTTPIIGGGVGAKPRRKLPLWPGGGLMSDLSGCLGFLVIVSGLFALAFSPAAVAFLIWWLIK